jgi:hypothetical protein
MPPALLSARPRLTKSAEIEELRRGRSANATLHPRRDCQRNQQVTGKDTFSWLLQHCPHREVFTPRLELRMKQRQRQTGRNFQSLTTCMTAVCTEILNPDVVMMKSAQDGVRFDASGSLNLARGRRIFVQ